MLNTLCNPVNISYNRQIVIDLFVLRHGLSLGTLNYQLVLEPKKSANVTPFRPRGERSFIKTLRRCAKRVLMANRRRDDVQQEDAGQLRVVQRLLALTVIDGKKQKDQVRLLAIAGMDRNEIAELLGTTPLTVSVAISNMRKQGVLRGKKPNQ
jgi:DNA-binding CsgD family transcriptional regulator